MFEKTLNVIFFASKIRYNLYISKVKKEDCISVHDGLLYTLTVIPSARPTIRLLAKIVFP